jgi:hypothetical protein
MTAQENRFRTPGVKMRAVKDADRVIVTSFSWFGELSGCDMKELTCPELMT